MNGETNSTKLQNYVLQSYSNWNSLRVAQKERKWPQIQTLDSHAHTGIYEKDKRSLSKWRQAEQTDKE